MKHLLAGEPLGFALDKPRTVKVGDVCGHLEVLEELSKSSGHDRRWKCRCMKVVDGKMCGNETIKKTGDLTRTTKFRACRGCTDAYMKETRSRWNKGWSY
jgi:hypothetical protein